MLVTATVLLMACEATDEPGADTSVDAGEDREEVVLTAVTAFPRDDMLHDGFWMYVDALEDAAPWITIDYRGGPEAIDGLEQGEAVQTGAVDMSALPETWYAHIVPYVHGMKFTPFMPSEERENGAYELINEAHEEQGLHYLGRPASNMPFQLFLNERIDGPDLSGLTFRVSPVYVPLVEGLGGSVVSMPPGDVYTAMERGVIDGFGWVSLGVIQMGWQEVTAYELLPTFYENTDTLIINLSVWEGLDEETRQVMTDVMIEVEPRITEMYGAIIDDERQERVDAGMELIELVGEDEQVFLTAAYEDGWEAAIEEEPRLQALRDIFGN